MSLPRTLGSPVGRHVLLALSLFCLGGCQRAPAVSNTLLIVIDTLRADRLGLYGSTGALSPTFDAFGAKAVVFDRAYSVTSWTNPTIAALFTGQEPRVLQPGAKRFIDASERTLAEVFRQRGYRTAAIVANPVLGPELGFAAGFEQYDGLAGWAHALEKLPKADGPRITDAALAWITQQQASHAPWFLYLHYMDPHWPYEPSLEKLRPLWKGDLPDQDAIAEINRQVRGHTYTPATLILAQALYDACVADVDAEVARLLEGLGREGALQNTVVAITADHGEEFGDHGGVLHARTLFEEVLRIPLLLLAPSTAAQRVERTVQIKDLGRTLLDVAGLPAASFPGHSLLSRSPLEAPLRAQLHRAPHTDHLLAVIAGTSKAISTASGQWLLYDLVRDPRERHDIADSEPALVKRLQTMTPPQPGDAAPPSDDPALRERMRALGYDF